MPFHTLAYIFKLNIEMSMAELVAKVACSNNHLAGKAFLDREAPEVPEGAKRSYSLTRRPDRTAMRLSKICESPKSDSFSSFILSDSRFEFKSHSLFRKDNGTFNIEREVHVLLASRDNTGIGLRGESAIGLGTREDVSSLAKSG